MARFWGAFLKFLFRLSIPINVRGGFFLGKSGVHMRTSFIPSTDGGLLAWSLNFQTLIAASPAAYGLTGAQVAAYQALHLAYAAALAACDPTMRSKSTVAVKNAARTDLKKNLKL